MLNKMEAQVNALKTLPEDETEPGSCAKKMTAASRGGANNHPIVKMSQQIRPPMTLQLTYLCASLSSMHCSMKCAGWI